MVLKNNSSKVIGINETSILPGDTEECPKGYENNPIIQKYITDGTFSLIKEEKKPQKTQKPKSDDDGKNGNPQNPDDSEKPNDQKR